MALKGTFEKYKGFRYNKNGISILMHCLSRTKENIKYTEEEQIKEAHIFYNYLNAVKTVDYTDKEFSKPLKPIDFSDCNQTVFYKYLPNEIYTNYLSKGILQLGSINYYRDTENQNIRDKMEGSCFLFINTQNRQISTCVLSGFNFYIFCGTKNYKKDQNMATQFGSCLIKINDIHSFARLIMKSINAKRYYFNYVRYSNQKILEVNDNIKDIEKVNPDLSEELFDCFYKHSFLPSLFIKPTRFQNENELRLVFEMYRDSKKFIRITNKGILEYIDVIN